ncbi:hypothetical protein Moror_6190 [Moniliophthora roreri MCA 2997]|uniref:Uncharacterized protein n=1 Tax=Moniliophthora roreri (strain MCA 2997) TaxID=1381753 RepID=V2WW91_MONRO|nr:hypothetical protein Moror_6190 [Moniliophthora roreri MCA 2997]
METQRMSRYYFPRNLLSWRTNVTHGGSDQVTWLRNEPCQESRNIGRAVRQSSVEADMPLPYASDPPFILGHYDSPRGQGYGERLLLQRKVQTLTTDKIEKAELAANLRSCTWMRQKPSQKAMNGLVSRSGFPYSNMMAAAAPVSSNPTVMERLRAVVPKTIEDMEVLAVRNG